MVTPDSRLQPELDTGEILLWQGTPNPARLAQRNTLPSIFGGCFVVFSLIWMAGAGFISLVISSATGWNLVALAPLFGLVFLVAGLVMLFSPLTAMKRGQNTVYALTDRRLIVWETRRVRSFTAREINALERRDLIDGRGDIIFRRDIHVDSDGDRTVQEAGFFGIPDAREVERLIRTHLQT